VAGVIERHREIACGQPRSPFGDDLPHGSVNDSDLIGRGKIHINAVATRVNLEPFGVGGQGDIPSLLPSCGIERGQPPAAVADHQPPRPVRADIVGIVAKPRSRPSESDQPPGTGAHFRPRVCDSNNYGSRRIPDSLRLMQPIDLADHFAGFEVDDSNGIGAEFADEQPLARNVDRHVIDPRREEA
jgi:hypothetical protein